MKEKVLMIEYSSDKAPYSRIFLRVKNSPTRKGYPIASGLYLTLPKSKNRFDQKKPTLRITPPIKFSDKLVERIMMCYFDLINMKRTHSRKNKPSLSKILGWRLLDL